MIKRIYIEITNRCNLSCSFCVKHKRDFKDMSLDELETIIVQCKSITSFIYLHVQGEPLMHSDFNAILTICDRYDMKVQLTTNATLLSSYPSLLSHPSIRKLSLSLHAYDELTINLDSLLSTIEHLEKTKTERQFIELRFWNKDGLRDNCKTIIEFLKKRYPFSATSKPNSYLLAPQLFLHYDVQFKWPSANPTLSKIGTCKGVKSMLCILSNGDVTPCCLDENADILIGNVFETPLESIILNPKYLAMMSGLNDNKLLEPLCQRCSYRNRFN